MKRPISTACWSGRSSSPTGRGLRRAAGNRNKRGSCAASASPPSSRIRGRARSPAGAGSACKLAALKLIEQARSLAAEKLEVEPSQVEYAAGVFHTRGSKRKISLGDLAKAGAINVMAEGSFGSTFPNGCPIFEGEIYPPPG